MTNRDKSNPEDSPPGHADPLRIGTDEPEALFRHMADTAPVMIWISGTDGKCFWFNRPWLDFTGRTLEEEIGDGWTDRVHPDDLEQCLRTYTEAFDAQEPFTMEYRLLRHDDEYRWLLDNGVPRHSKSGEFIGFIGSCLDITERRTIEQALQASEQRLRMLVESATEFAIFIVGDNGRIESWSEGAERLFGYAEHEIIGAPMAVLFSKEDREDGVPERELEVARSQGRSYDDRWHRKKDGSRFFATGAVSPIRGSHPVRFVKIARDLTERKRMEEALKEADTRKNDFIATLAHELRNPLAPIRTGLEILRDPKSSEAVKAEVLAIMDRQMDQMVYLVDDLLEISRIAHGKIHLQKEPVELAGLVRLAVESCRGEAESKNHDLELSAQDEPLVVTGDAVRLEQVFINLLTNAIKYTYQNGKIHVILSRDGDQAVVRVRDNGVGIAPDQLTEIFGMFNQVGPAGRNPTGGLGIGLSVVKSMVEMHGGCVSATSEGPDTGSEFTVRLPLADARDEDEFDTVADFLPDAKSPARGRRVLVVDDNRDAADMLRAALLSHGYKVQVAHSGSMALEEARKSRPDICVCDIGLPDINGHEVARLLANAHPGILLISISGWGQESDRAKSEEAGFVRHLVKPVRLGDLIELLEQGGS